MVNWRKAGLILGEIDEKSYRVSGLKLWGLIGFLLSEWSVQNGVRKKKVYWGDYLVDREVVDKLEFKKCKKVKSDSDSFKCN